MVSQTGSGSVEGHFRMVRTYFGAPKYTPRVGASLLLAGQLAVITFLPPLGKTLPARSSKTSFAQGFRAFVLLGMFGLVVTAHLEAMRLNSSGQAWS